MNMQQALDSVPHLLLCREDEAELVHNAAFSLIVTMTAEGEVEPGAKRQFLMVQRSLSRSLAYDCFMATLPSVLLSLEKEEVVSRALVRHRAKLTIQPQDFIFAEV